MDTKRLNYEDVKEVTYQDILSRMENEPFDYVIAADDAALTFVMEYRDKLFSGIPIIFEGINDENFAYKAAEDPLITGIVETFPLEETIAMALKINPKATRIVGITDDTVSGRGSTKQFLDCQKSFSKLSFSTIDCSVLTCDEIGKAVADCGDDTILIYLMMTTDADGNTYSHTEATEYTGACANIPIYKADELGLGVSILGGVMVSYHDMAAAAASIVLALEHGEDIADYPVQTAPAFCAFDGKVMQQFGISKDDVSDAYNGEIEYVNDELSFFQRHKSVLIPAGIIIVILIAFSLLTVSIIRKKKKLMEQLEDKELMLKSLLGNIPGGLAIYRIRGLEQNTIDTLYSSEGIPKLSGRTMEEYEQWIESGLFQSTVYEEDLPRFYQILAETIPEKKPVYVQYHLKCKDGSLRLISLSAVWAYDEPDGSRIYYAVYMDNTEREKAQIAEREAFEANASNEAKGEFLSTMSHDIRTPLNAVLGFAALAQDEADVPDAVMDYLKKINSSGKYLLSLINDVLDMSKIESCKMELHEESVDSFMMISEVAELFRSQAAEKGIKLSTDFAGAKTQWLVLDELRVRQIYANLLSNAVKFSNSGTEIHWQIIEERIDPDIVHTVSIISDQGCGMSKEFMERVFQPFEQGNPSYAMTGTGLGLAIVQNLVRLMNGTIKVESEPGKGSTFIFALDRKIGTPQKTVSPQIHRPSESLDGRRILLCEDNNINVMVARKLLEKAGCIVDVAENGRLGLEQFAQSSNGFYFAILMDIRMPEMDGIEATKAIRKLDRPDAKTIPIIAMSANAFDEDVKTSLDAGMDAHMAKPVDPQKLYATLEKQIH